MNQIVSLTFLCHLHDLQADAARGFDPCGSGRDTVLALLVAGRAKVFRNDCPHLNVPMQYRKDRFMTPDGQYIVCFAHGARFLPESGLCVSGPCLGQSLTEQACSVDEEGRVWLEN